MVDPTVWDNYFKFCVERNPWDRVISYYFWHFQNEKPPPLSDALHSNLILRDVKQRGIGLYVVDRKIAVDKILHYENLGQELEIIRQLIGIPEPLTLPNAKSRFRKDKGSYRDYFNESDKKFVEKLFADEIRLFGYQF